MSRVRFTGDLKDNDRNASRNLNASTDEDLVPARHVDIFPDEERNPIQVGTGTPKDVKSRLMAARSKLHNAFGVPGVRRHSEDDDEEDSGSEADATKPLWARKGMAGSTEMRMSVLRKLGALIRQRETDAAAAKAAEMEKATNATGDDMPSPLQPSQNPIQTSLVRESNFSTDKLIALAEQTVDRGARLAKLQSKLSGVKARARARFLANNQVLVDKIAAAANSPSPTSLQQPDQAPPGQSESMTKLGEQSNSNYGGSISAPQLQRGSSEGDQQATDNQSPPSSPPSASTTTTTSTVPSVIVSQSSPAHGMHTLTGHACRTSSYRRHYHRKRSPSPRHRGLAQPGLPILKAKSYHVGDRLRGHRHAVRRTGSGTATSGSGVAGGGDSSSASSVSRSPGPSPRHRSFKPYAYPSHVPPDDSGDIRIHLLTGLLQPEPPNPITRSANASPVNGERSPRHGKSMKGDYQTIPLDSIPRSTSFPEELKHNATASGAHTARDGTVLPPIVDRTRSSHRYDLYRPGGQGKGAPVPLYDKVKLNKLHASKMSELEFQALENQLDPILVNALRHGKARQHGDE